MKIKLINASFRTRKWRLMIIMRTFIFLCCTTMFAFTPMDIVSQNSKVKITESKSLTVDEVFDLIMDQTDYKFFYEEGIFKDYPKVSVKKGIIRTNKLLQQSLSQGNLDIEITDKNAILIKVNSQKNIKDSAQQNIISGTITDLDGFPLPGANIVEKGTTNGTQSDFDGKYSLKLVNANTTLVISYLGYISQEIIVAGQTSIDVVLKEASSILEEVVVVGYGTQKKANISGSISTVELNNVENRPVTHLSQALAGAVSGVSTFQSSGEPGNDDIRILIRGVNTINNTNPLVIVDGAPGSMSNVSSNDVASISVLKDAASSAIYGSRAANGVILITTKKGKSGKVSASYNSFYGISQATRLPEFVSNSADYMELRNIAFANGGRPADDPYYPLETIDAFRNSNDPIRYPNTDWMDYVIGGTGEIKSHNVILQGGSDQSRYRISLGYLDQTGVQPNTGADHYTLRTSLNSKVSEKFKIGMNIYSRWQNRYNPGSANQGLFSAERSSPMTLPIHPDGRYGGAGTDQDGAIFNPKQDLETNFREIEEQRLTTNIKADYEIFKGLTLGGNVSFSLTHTHNKSYNLPYQLWNFRDDTVEFEDQLININLNEASSRFYRVTLTSTINYATTINDNHNLNVLVGAEQDGIHNRWISGSAQGFVTENLLVLNASQGGVENTNVGGSATDDTLRSFFGNLTYDFKEKYLLTANVRYDASSRFNPDFRWGLFPAFSAAWKISKEGFMENVDFISNLQLRVGWGQVGNNTLPLYKYFSSYDFDNPDGTANSYFLGGSLQPGVAVSELANPLVEWETTTGKDLGIDLGFLNNSLTVSLGLFEKLTEDVLLDTSIPAEVGVFTPPTRNLGIVQNKGWELDVNYRKKIKDLSFNIGFNLSHVKNKVVRFNDVPNLGRHLIKTGEPIWSLFGYETAGLFQDDQDVADWPVQFGLPNDPTNANSYGPGDIKFVDQLTVDTDGDGIPDEADGVINEDDRVILGNPFPKYTYGITLGADWKGFDLSAQLQGREGSKGWLLGTVAFGHSQNGERGHIPAKYKNAWSPENPNSTIPRLNSNIYSQNDNDYYIQNTSFLKVKSLQLGYSLPSEVIGKMGMTKLRVYLSGENLFTFTQFEGFDPERGLTSSGVSYPIHKTYTFGINLTF